MSSGETTTSSHSPGNEQDIISKMGNQVFDEAISTMHNKIAEDVQKSPLLGDRQSVSELSSEYGADNSSYQDKIKKLSETYSSLRKTRGDGNCFFRSFGFGYLEHLMNNKEDFKKFKEKASKTFQKLVDLKYPSFTVEDFFDNFMETVESVASDDFKTEDLIKTFRDDATANYFIVYLRLITSCQIQSQADHYQNFVDNGKTVVDFCKHEVEPMYRESDHIHIIALTTALDANIRVVYMDHSNENLLIHNFPESTTPAIHLLYRPGHYDLLYSK